MSLYHNFGKVSPHLNQTLHSWVMSNSFKTVKEPEAYPPWYESIDGSAKLNLLPQSLDRFGFTHHVLQLNWISNLLNHIPFQNGFQGDDARTKVVNSSRFHFRASRFTTHLIRLHATSSTASQSVWMYSSPSCITNSTSYKNVQMSSKAKWKF